jgi:hypothetical protein
MSLYTFLCMLSEVGAVVGGITLGFDWTHNFSKITWSNYVACSQWAQSFRDYL